MGLTCRSETSSSPTVFSTLPLASVAPRSDNTATIASDGHSEMERDAYGIPIVAPV